MSVRIGAGPLLCPRHTPPLPPLPCTLRDLQLEAEAGPRTTVLRYRQLQRQAGTRQRPDCPASCCLPTTLSGPMSPTPSLLAEFLTWLLPFLGPSSGVGLEEAGVGESAVGILNEAAQCKATQALGPMPPTVGSQLCHFITVCLAGFLTSVHQFLQLSNGHGNSLL